MSTVTLTKERLEEILRDELHKFQKGVFEDMFLASGALMKDGMAASDAVAAAATHMASVFGVDVMALIQRGQKEGLPK